ncbi:hypothetical protein [Caulobacter sp. CCH9-E1]|uniref:hypothetical protein n=1 Tax=Caulobacter sp. CCH9-E1 TaxID=1768768 RepID=UPI0008310551|nr:hypothetical protein [Caulobacter sp. CCH9-E1]
MSTQQKYTVVFDGVVTAVSPLCTNPPDVAQKPARQPTMTVYYGAVAENVPYFPAAGFRGKLRRKAIDVVSRARNEGMTLDSYYYNAIGGVKDSGEEDSNPLTTMKERRQMNPIIGLYGAGDPWVKGCANIGHMVPIEPIKPFVVTGTRNDDFKKGEKALDMLAPEEHARWADLNRNNAQRSRKEKQLKKLQSDARAATGVEKDALEAQVTALTQEIEEHKAVSGSVSVNLPLAGYEAIPQGAQLKQLIVLTEATEEEIGLFLATLQEFAFDPRVGSRFSQGNGVISARWDVRVRRSGEISPTSLGQVAVEPYVGVEIQDQFLLDSVALFNTRLHEGAYNFDAVD